MTKEIQEIKKALGWNTNYSEMYKGKHHQITFSSDFELLRNQLQDFTGQFTKGI